MPGQTSGTLFPMAISGFPLNTLMFMESSTPPQTARQLQPCHSRVISALMDFNVCEPRLKAQMLSVKLPITPNISLFADDNAFCYGEHIRSGTELHFLCRQYITNTFVKLFPAEPVCLPTCTPVIYFLNLN